MIFKGASELPTGISAQLPANGSPANRSARKVIASGKNCKPAWVCSAPAYTLSWTGTPSPQYWCASPCTSLTIITWSPVPSAFPTPMNIGISGWPGVLPMISLLMVLANGRILRKAWYFFLSSCWIRSPG